MTKKMVWVALSCLMVISLALTSCQPAATVEKEEERTVTGTGVEKETTEVPAAEKEEDVEAVAEGKEMVVDSLGRLVQKPQYGGSIYLAQDIQAWDDYMDPCHRHAGKIASYAYESMLWIDWMKGPNGTGEIPLTGALPAMEDYTGLLAESWEILSLTEIIFHIRKGVHFHDIPPVNGREMTAEDVVYTFERSLSLPESTWYPPEGTEIEDWHKFELVDKWTMRFVAATPNWAWLSGFDWWAIAAQEMAEADGGLKNWRNLAGTGAYMIESLIPDASVTFTRNPNYWMMDPLHPDNQLPYIERINLLDIPDSSTSLAALRTHKLSARDINKDEFAGIRQSNPELSWKAMAPSGYWFLYMNVYTPPFDDVRVRWAMALAIDNQTVVDDYFGGNAEYPCGPMDPPGTAGYMSIAELPTDEIYPGLTRAMLFEYHPDLAKQLLADAGYPNGITFELLTRPGATREAENAIIQEMCREVGLMAEMKMVDGATFAAHNRGEYKNAVYNWTKPNDFGKYFFWGGNPSRGISNVGTVSDPVSEEVYETLKGTLDEAERVAILKADMPRIVEACTMLALWAPHGYTFWMPWIRQYEASAAIGGCGQGSYKGWQFAWLDQEEMGK